jgi:hypothetical protein
MPGCTSLPEELNGLAAERVRIGENVNEAGEP